MGSRFPQTGRALWWVLLAFILGVAISAPWTNIPGDNADSAGMQAHLHGFFQTRELLYDDEYAALGMSPLFAFVTPEGGVVSNHWPVGASFLQAPGWLLGHAAGVSLTADGISSRAADYAIPLLGARSWAVMVFLALVAGVFVWFRKAGVEPKTTTMACLGFAVGTPLAYYAFEAPIRPHLWGAAVVTILVLRWMGAIADASRDPERARAQWRPALELAALVGLATAIRPQLAPLVLLVAHERFVASDDLGWIPRTKFLLVHGVVAAAVFALWPLLVVRMQLWMYGGFSNYSGEVAHHLRPFLLSTHHGALVWCPVLVLAGLGLAIGAARHQRGALLLLGLIAMQIWLNTGTREIEPYTVLGTRTWSGGTAFGPRKLLDAVPLTLPGVVWISGWLGSLDETERRVWQQRLAVVWVLALVPTLLLSAAAWVEPKVTTEVLDGERLSIAMTLPFDPDNWRTAWAQRAVPTHIFRRLVLVVCLPLATALVLAGWAAVAASKASELAEPKRPMTKWWLGGGITLAGVLANLWLSHLLIRTEALLEREPARVEAASGQLDPWHEATVRQIPRHKALMRERLDDPDL